MLFVFHLRSWKMYFMTLRDMVLYCFKDEKSVRVPGSFDDLSQAIRVHHGLAVRSDHRKKQFVFRLYTADQAQYLFQTSDEKELLTWIDSINAVVARFESWRSFFRSQVQRNMRGFKCVKSPLCRTLIWTTL